MLSPVAENPATLIESGFASRASTHKVKQVAKVRKSSTAARYTPSANSRCEQMKANRFLHARTYARGGWSAQYLVVSKQSDNKVAEGQAHFALAKGAP